jgi:hypothetical protein
MIHHPWGKGSEGSASSGKILLSINSAAAANFGGFSVIRFTLRFARPMRSTLKAALLAALPLEIVNLWVIGYPTAGGSLTTASQNAGIALEWDLLHLPGLIAIDRILFLREHLQICSVVFLFAGYIDTAILLAAIIGALRLVLRTLRRLSSPMKTAL